MLLFFLLLMNSPICFLSNFGFCLMKETISPGSSCWDKNPCFCKYVIPSWGFTLNCSVPAWYIWISNNCRTILNVNNVQIPIQIQNVTHFFLVLCGAKIFTCWNLLWCFHSVGSHFCELCIHSETFSNWKFLFIYTFNYYINNNLI